MPSEDYSQESGEWSSHGGKRVGRGIASVSPVEQVAPWVLREGTDTVKYAGNAPPGVFDATQVDQEEEDEDSATLYSLKMKMTNAPPKKVAPLRTHGLLPGKGSLPMLATPYQEACSKGDGTFDGYSFLNSSSSPPPLPLPKSGQSDTLGCADLPPPPPPSHSPDHKYRIQSFLSRKRTPKQPWSDMPLPPVPFSSEGINSPLAPTPVSKGGMNSASSYPTVSDSAIPASSRIKSPHPPSSSTSRLSRKAGRRSLNEDARPRSAGEGQAARSPFRSPLSMGPSSVGGAVKNSFIVFSVNRGSAIDARSSFMTQGSQSRQPQSHQHKNVTSTPSDYSHNDSLSMASPPYAASDNCRDSSISKYLDMIPPAPKTAAIPAYNSKKSIDKSHYRRSSSFDEFSRPRKESLRQETMNKPSWFKMTRDREKKRMTEYESEEKIVEAEREIQEQEEEFQDEEEDGFTIPNSITSSQRENGGYEEIDVYQQDWPLSGSRGRDEDDDDDMSGIGSAASPRFQRQRCLSDQPYAGLYTLSPATMSPSIRSPRSPSFQS